MRQPTYMFIWFRLAMLITDCLLVPVTIITAYSLKFKVGWVAQKIFEIPVGQIYQHAQVEPYIANMGIVFFVWILTFAVSGMYSIKTGLMPVINGFITTIKSVTIATLILTVFTFVFQAFPDSRFVIFYSWIIGIFYLTLGRWMLWKVLIKLLKKGIGSKKAIVIGATDIGQDIVEKIHLYPALGIIYTGTVDEESPKTIHFHLKQVFKWLGKTDDLMSILSEHECDIIFITNKLKKAQTTKLLKYAQDNLIEVRQLSNDMELLHDLAISESFDSIPFVVKNRSFLRPSMIVKCIADRIAAILLLIALCPVLIAIGLWIKLVSPKGPILYSQDRVTMNNAVFKMIKFRTMIPDAEAKTGPVMVNESGDSRYIKGGEFLRKTSLDELPQLWNVLVGHMSIIGPRPERPHFIKEFNKTIPNFEQRHQVKGGITGWAQVNGRSVLTRKPEQKLKYDLYYIKNWSLLFDFKILLLTFVVVLNREEAY